MTYNITPAVRWGTTPISTPRNTTIPTKTLPQRWLVAARGGAGGDSTFELMGERNPSENKGYGLEDSGELAFIQQVKSTKKLKVKPWWIILDPGSMLNLI